MSVAISADPTISGVVLAEQASTPSSPASGKRKLFVDTSGVLKLVDSAGAASSAGTGAFVPLTIFDAKGDLIVGSAADAALRLAVGTNGHVLTADSAESTGVKWAAVSAGAHSIEGASHTTAGGTDGYALRQTGATAFAWEADYAALCFTFGDGTNAIVAASEPDQWIRLPFAGVIVRASLGADASGSFVCDIWVDTHANYPPAVADTITASAKPTLSSAISSQDTTLTGWSATLAEGSWLRVHVDSSSTCKRVVLELRIRRT
jgi:hypothetical protein